MNTQLLMLEKKKKKHRRISRTNISFSMCKYKLSSITMAKTRFERKSYHSIAIHCAED
jgi:hypothetical protein